MEARQRIGRGDGFGETVGDKEGQRTRQRSFSHSILEFDHRLTKCLAICANSDSTYGFLRPVMLLLELSAHGVPWIVGNVLAIFIAHQTKTQQQLLNLLMALIIDVLVVMIIKLAFRRPRPRHNRMDMFGTVTAIDGFSFPSGHTTRTAMVVCFLLTQFSLGPWTIVVLLLWAVGVAISRVMLGRHYFLDVISGVVIGLLQYKYIVLPLWLSARTCEVLLQPIREELHI